MHGARHTLASSPLVAIEVQRWRRRWPWLLPAVLAAMLLACAITVVPALIASRDATGTADFASFLLVVGWAGSCAAGLAWFVVLIAIPVLAGTAVSRLRDSGLGDSLRVTLLTGHDIADGYLIRALLRYPAWLLGAALLPLGSATGLTSGLVLPYQSAGTSGPDPVTWIATLAYPAINTLVALAQLAACVELGVLAGLHTRSAGNAAAVTLGGLFVFELLLPSGCGLCLSFSQILVLEATAVEHGVTGSAALYTLLVGLGGMSLELLYQLGLFFIARAFAARRFDQGEA